MSKKSPHKALENALKSQDKGALHRALGIPQGQKIPAGTFDVNELRVVEASELRENDIGVVTLRTATPLAVDPYEADRITGSFVLIDERTYATIAAGMVGPPRLHD